jgi:hypothetical protein
MAIAISSPSSNLCLLSSVPAVNKHWVEQALSQSHVSPLANAVQ